MEGSNLDVKPDLVGSSACNIGPSARRDKQFSYNRFDPNGAPRHNRNARNNRIWSGRRANDVSRFGTTGTV